MEIILNDVGYLKYLKDININFISNNIYGITGKNYNYLIQIINGDINRYAGQIVADKRIKTSLISSSDNLFYTTTVKEELNFIFKNNCHGKINYKQQAVEIFYQFDLDDSFFNRSIQTLSKSERYLFKITLGLIIDPDILIFNHIFDGLDRKYRKKIIDLLHKLKKDKIIIVGDSDVDILYDITDYMYILSNNKIVLTGKTDNIYQNVVTLKKLKVDVPCLSDLTYLAKMKKNVKLFYRKDIRDVMKDIYRNV